MHAALECNQVIDSRHCIVYNNKVYIVYSSVYLGDLDDLAIMSLIPKLNHFTIAPIWCDIIDR